MRFSAREIALALATVSVLLFSLTALMFRNRWPEWTEQRREMVNLKELIRLDREMIAQRERWESELGTLSRQLSRHGATEQMDVHWLSVMDRIAAKNGITISRRQVGEEKRQGEVYELPIECKDWEGDLDALVHFLFDLQSEGAMFDVRQLLTKPKGQLLRGRLMLYCAYTRETGASDDGG
jgi:hypothetical protein